MQPLSNAWPPSISTNCEVARPLLGVAVLTGIDGRVGPVVVAAVKASILVATVALLWMAEKKKDMIKINNQETFLHNISEVVYHLWREKMQSLKHNNAYN